MTRLRRPQPPAALPEVLRAVDLAKQYRGRAVVDQVSVQVERGEIVGLLGPNGAGKTTCFYMIAGLVPVDSGHIWLGNRSRPGPDSVIWRRRRRSFAN